MSTTSGHEVPLMSNTSNQSDAGGEMAGKVKEYTLNTNTIYYSVGNVHFITSDNVLFPFDLDRLAKVSSVFRDLRNIPQPSGKEIGAPISGQTILEKLNELSLNEREDISRHTDAVIIFPECNAKALQPWLNLVSLSGAHGLNLNISCEECEMLYTLMDKYGCDESLYECLRCQIKFMTGEKEWEMFIMASHGNDRVLGSRVLQSMSNNAFFAGGFASRLERLSDSWALAVYHAVFNKDINWELTVEYQVLCHQLPRYPPVGPSKYINFDSWKDDLLATFFADV
ncbi:hypothetical protein L198_07911 [Cryptococcus wingfieldii CBS 7118]|uniref:BTB domain-containing protein n=1 Tax=Cryptococcus wingfieldii CBS 7118 TaxID=1295528 RepID=A0A1E3HUK4_9TREE|nr:hypothetical protein L198_07911 [Cryptococcus wingfieldii CBS 7118]ODN79161.1 hypothetical protein L198_07911 [Cryptococcus wingfieldii CBS 7118]